MTNNKQTKNKLLSKIDVLQKRIDELEQLETSSNHNPDIIRDRNLLHEAGRLAKVGGWIWDVNTQSMYWTDETYHIHEIDPKNIKAGSIEHLKKSVSCYQVKDRPIISEAFRKCEEEGIPYDMEFPFTTTKGVPKWIRTVAKPKKEDGKIVSVIGNIMDITETKRSEDAILASRKQLEAVAHIGFSANALQDIDKVLNGILQDTLKLIHASIGMIFLVDRDSGELSWGTSSGLSDHFVASFKQNTIKPGEGLTGQISQTGKAIIILENSSQDSRIVRPIIQKEDLNSFIGIPIFAGEEIVAVMNILTKRPDILKEEDISLIRAIGTHVGSAILNARSFKEREFAEIALSESDYRYDLAMQATRDGIYDWNLETNDIYYSPSWKNILGYRDDELPNDFSIWEKLTEPEDVKRSWEMLQELINKERDRFELEFKMKHKDGHWVNILSRSDAVFDESGKAIRIVGTHTDITKRKEAERQLLESRERFKDIAESMSDWVWEVDADGKYIYSSTTGSEILGYQNDEIIGKTPFDFISADAVANMSVILGNIMREKKPFRNLENWNLTKDGQKVCLSTSGLPVINNRGELTGYRGVNTDITDRKQMIDKLHGSEELFRKAFSTSPDSISINRLNDGAYVSINKGFSKILGYSEADVLGKSTQEVTIWNNLEDREVLIASLREKGEVQNLEAQFKKKNGETVYGLMFAKVIDLDHIPHVISITRDITTRKKNEAEVLAGHNQLDSIFKVSPVGIGLVVDRRITFVNDLFIEMVGYDREELIGNKSRLIYPSDAEFDRVGKYKYQQIQEKGSGTVETVFKKKDGTLLEVLLSSAPLNINNLSEGVTFTALDISERKRAESRQKSLKKQLHQAQKLEAVGTMVGGISHELNNILQSIFLYGGLIQEELPENTSIQKNMKQLLDDGERARDIVKQILTFSRKTKVDMKTQLLHELILEALSLERASLPSNVAIKQEIDMNCGPILCDKTQIHQIVINLCNNAQHAMGEKGGILTVSLAQSRASIGLDKPETEVLELKIQDTGHGIDEATLEMIFDPFFTTKGIGTGTGLGLSVIHGIVEMMQGQITATSMPGIGTTFRILFPVAADTNAHDLTSAKKKQLESMKKTILLVDDEDSIRLATQTVLTRKGFTVTTAADGELALDLFKANPGKFDLIVTDQSMPKMSGTDLALAIKGTPSKVPIILSTGQLGIEDKQEYTDIGITGFIQKPWTAEELIQCIDKYDNKV